MFCSRSVVTYFVKIKPQHIFSTEDELKLDDVELRCGVSCVVHGLVIHLGCRDTKTTRMFIVWKWFGLLIWHCGTYRCRKFGAEHMLLLFLLVNAGLYEWISTAVVEKFVYLFCWCLQKLWEFLCWFCFSSDWRIIFNQRQFSKWYCLLTFCYLFDLCLSLFRCSLPSLSLHCSLSLSLSCVSRLF